MVALSAILVASIVVLFSFAQKDLVRILERQGVSQERLNAITGSTDAAEEGAPEGFFEPPAGLQAEAYSVKIIGEKQPLLKQREWKRLAPASLTKILTAAVAREELENIVWLSVSEDAKKTEAKISPLETDEFVTAEDMLRLALIASYNDAAQALAEAVGKKYGGQTFEDRLRIFRERMNEKARMIGLMNSDFLNATGLDEEGHFSTAEDLTRLAEYVKNNDLKIWEISRTLETKIYTGSGREIALVNTNKLLQEFPGISGGKTGFTDNAGESLLFLYPVRPDKTVIIVILDSKDRFEDGRKIIRWLETINE